MGCFIPCFFITKLRNSRKKLSTISSAHKKHVANQVIQPKKAIKKEIRKKPRDENEEKFRHSGSRRVTINLKVKSYDRLSILEVTNCLVENEREKERKKGQQELLLIQESTKFSEENEKEQKKEGEDFLLKQETRKFSVENDEEKEKEMEVKIETRIERENCSVIKEEKGKEKKVKEETRNERENCKVENVGKDKGKEVKEETRNERETQLDSSVSIMVSYPILHRYHNWTSKGDECCEDMALKEIKSDEDAVVDLELDQEDSSELFSLSIESRKKIDTVENDEKEVTSPLTNLSLLPEEEARASELYQNAKERSQCADLGLKPVENLDEKKVAKLITTPYWKRKKDNINMEKELDAPFSQEPNFRLLNQNAKQKATHQNSRCHKMIENINMEKELDSIPSSEEPSFKWSTQISPQDQVNAVDISLSSWLVESEETPNAKSNSPSSSSGGSSTSDRTIFPRSFEGRPTWGALTVEELKSMSDTSLPRRSPGLSQSPNDMPIVGTVGSCWRHAGQSHEFKPGFHLASERKAHEASAERKKQLFSCLLIS